MKICHVITRLIIGGAQENTVLTCRGLVAKGHEVTLIAGPETGPEGSLWPEAKASGARLIELDALRREVSLGNDLRASRKLTELMREIDPDVVHTHSSKAGIWGRAAAARARVGVIIHTIHGMSFNRTQRWWTRAAYRELERWAARRTSKIVCVADAMIEQAAAARIAPREQMITIRSGLEVDRFAPDAAARRSVRAKWGVADDEVVVGTVARLFGNKGYEDIIAVMPKVVREVPKVKFAWVGDGAQREGYVRELENMGLRERVILTGLVPPSEVARLLNGFDMLVHTSRWEGLPRAVVQALLTEIPVVSYDNDGAPEVVITGQTGMLVRLGDGCGLGRAITTMAQSPQIRKQMGSAGRERCLKEFDWRIMVEQLEHLYLKLLRKPRPA